MTDVVDTLLRLTEGQEVALAAKYYEFASAYEVASIDEETFGCPTGGVWRAREIVFRSVDSGGRSGEYTVTAVYGADPPEVGSYGELVGVEVDPDSSGDEQDEEQDRESEGAYECEQCGQECASEAWLKRHHYQDHIRGSEADTDVPDGDDSWRELDAKARERGETA